MAATACFDRAREIVAGHNGVVSDASNNRLWVEIPAADAINAVPRLTSAGFNCEFQGSQTRHLPAMRAGPEGVRRHCPAFSIDIRGELVAQEKEPVPVMVYIVSVPQQKVKQ